jgi:hypothetical protein
MNPTVQKYAPPMIVLGAALYLGWPPAAPLDLGENLVQAKAVRWKSRDLEPPTAPGTIVDPFRPVLVVAAEPTPVAAAAEDAVAAPPGPTVDELRAAVKLSGIANTGGRAWAILNGRPRLVGEVIKTDDKAVPNCKLVAIEKDHVLLQCHQTFAVIRPQVSGSTGKKTTSDPVNEVTPEVNPTPAAVPAPPPPNVGPPPLA